MRRFFTAYWQHRFWNPKDNDEYQPIITSGSNLFSQRGVSLGDEVYIVSVGKGQLYLGGRITVKEVVSRSKAVKILGRSDLYDEAEEWVIGEKNSGTLLNLKRRLAPEITKKLLFSSVKSDPKPLFFSGKNELDVQTLRGIRELTVESASLFDQIIEITDSFPQGEEIVVTSEILKEGRGSIVVKKQQTKPSATSAIEKIILSKEVEYFDEPLFNPSSIEDAREKISTTIVRRRGQPEFRKKLIEAYNGCCAITGTNAEQALEAAHILQYKGKETNHISNGLLLRADIHTLFDLGLIAIDTKTMTVVIAPSLSNTTYKELLGKSLLLPKNKKCLPNIEALDLHRREAAF